MGVVRIEGKEVTLDDAIIEAGKPAIIDALSVDFPDVENAEIEIVRPKAAGEPIAAQVVKRGTHKGVGDALSLAQMDVLAVLDASPEYINPAIALAAEVMQAEARGDTGFLEKAIRSGRLERAVEAGEREGRAVQKALSSMSLGIPQASRTVPTGF